MVLHVHISEPVLKCDFHPHLSYSSRVCTGQNLKTAPAILGRTVGYLRDGHDGLNDIGCHDDDATAWNIDSAILVRVAGKRMAAPVLAIYPVLVYHFRYEDTGRLFPRGVHIPYDNTYQVVVSPRSDLVIFYFFPLFFTPMYQFNFEKTVG